MTGLMRLAGCDLFIHGTGGGAYDLVTEEWLGSWMGWTLALLVLREMLPSDGASAPSINGVVGSSLYISCAVGNFVFAAQLKREMINMSAWCSALAPVMLRGHL